MPQPSIAIRPSSFGDRLTYSVIRGPISLTARPPTIPHIGSCFRAASQRRLEGTVPFLITPPRNRDLHRIGHAALESTTPSVKLDQTMIVPVDIA